MLACDTETDALPSGNRTDPELYRSLDNPHESIKSCSKKSRRRSLPVGPVLQSGEDDDDDDGESNGDHLKRERMLFLQKRQQRKLKKRQYSTQTSEEDAGALPSEGSDQEEATSFEINSCSEDLTRPIITFDACSFAHDDDVMLRYMSTSKLSLESISDSSSVLSYATKESSLSDSTESPLLTRIKRQNAVYGSSSSSVFSDTKQSDSQVRTNSPHPVRNTNSPKHTRNTNSPTPVRNANSPIPVRSTSSPIPVRNANSPIPVTNANSPILVRDASSPIASRNANSPSHVRNTDSPHPGRKSCSPNFLRHADSPKSVRSVNSPISVRSSSSPISVRNGQNPDSSPNQATKESRRAENKQDMMNRRITLSKCECISPTDKEQTKRIGK